jgi:hypothetical protein
VPQLWRKGQDWLIQFGRLTEHPKEYTQATYGNYTYLLQSPACYMLLIYSDPTAEHRQENKGWAIKASHVNKLASIQRRVALMITGAMKTTATDVVEVMANLIPFNLLVDKYRQRSHPTCNTTTNTPPPQACQKCSKQTGKTHATLLHDLMHRFNIRPQSIETIKAVRFDTGLETENQDQDANKR